MAINRRKPIKVSPDLRLTKTNKENVDKKFSANDGDIDININDARWEHLMDEKNKAIDSMIANQGLITGLVKNLETKLHILEPYQEVLVGLFKSFEDISDLLRKNMECHVIFDNDNKITDYKKGKISQDNDDFADYLKIYGNYIFATEQIGDLTYKAYADIISLIRESVEFESLDQATKDSINAHQEKVKEFELGEQNGTDTKHK